MPPLPLWFETACLLISIFCFKYIRDKPLIWFIPFLSLMVVVEFAGWYMRTIAHVHNTWMYNISIPIEYIFYTFIFYKSYHNPVFRKISEVLLYAIPIAALLNILFIQGLFNFNTIILSAGSCIMVFLCCLYFIDLFKRDTEFVLLKEPMFWITTALLFFNLGGLSYSLFFSYLLNHGHDAQAKLFSSIVDVLVYVLYTMISIALLCTRKTFRKT